MQTQDYGGRACSRLVATRLSVEAFLHRVDVSSPVSLSPDPSPAIPRLRLNVYDHFVVIRASLRYKVLANT